LIGCKLDEDSCGCFSGVTWIKMKGLTIQKQQEKVKDENLPMRNQLTTKSKIK
jgi:hypothetical protein